MQVEIKVDSTQTEPKIIIVTNSVTDEISDLLRELSYIKPQLIAGFYNNTVVLLEQEKIVYIYSSNNKIYAVTDENEYLLKLRLYELENRLNKKYFVRISNSEIINLRYAKEFDLSISGTICVSLSKGRTAYVSRRYVTRIKQLLGI